MHCANTGAMLACVYPGLPLYYSTSENPTRKLPHSVELVEDPEGHLICVNTVQANRVVGEMLANGAFEPLADETFRSEVRIPDESGRFDFGSERTFVEVKSVTYRIEQTGAFPDAKSDRAKKHIEALSRRVKDGQRGALVFCSLHTGIQKVTVAREIDPMYAEAVQKAIAMGVEVYAIACEVTPRRLLFSRRIPFDL